MRIVRMSDALLNKILFFIIFSFLNFHSSSAIASDFNLCICQTGSTPSSKISIFKLGCRKWRLSQSCDEKITVSINYSIEELISNRPGIKNVKLGYVGSRPKVNSVHRPLLKISNRVDQRLLLNLPRARRLKNLMPFFRFI